MWPPRWMLTWEKALSNRGEWRGESRRADGGQSSGAGGKRSKEEVGRL
jgi:hypothetical protein